MSKVYYRTTILVRQRTASGIFWRFTTELAIEEGEKNVRGALIDEFARRFAHVFEPDHIGRFRKGDGSIAANLEWTQVLADPTNYFVEETPNIFIATKLDDGKQFVLFWGGQDAVQAQKALKIRASENDRQRRTYLGET